MSKWLILYLQPQLRQFEGGKTVFWRETHIDLAEIPNWHELKISVDLSRTKIKPSFWPQSPSMRQERRADIRADLQERQAHTDRLMAMSGQPVQQEIWWFCWSWVRFLSFFWTFETMKKASLKHVGNLISGVIYIIYMIWYDMSEYKIMTSILTWSSSSTLRSSAG